MMLRSVSTSEASAWTPPSYRRVLLAIILLGAVACLALGTFIGLLWAISHPERAPHGGLLLGLPGGFLFLEGLLLGLGCLWIYKRWRGFAFGAPLVGVVLPLAAVVNHQVIWVASFVGLAPFALLAWLIRSLS
jgi:hypothetical protein